MSRIIHWHTTDGQPIEFVDQVISAGTMKDVYFSSDQSYVVAFYRVTPDAVARQRLEMIVGRYREGIFKQAGGDYWHNLFCWPTAIVEYNGRLGLVAPVYPRNFFFEHGSKNDDSMQIQGREKEGKWFATARLRQRFLDPRELGNWLNHLKIVLQLSRAIRRMHAAGLAHSDLSYKNVLVDPVLGKACVIDVDGLVVPGKYPPDVVGTPDFIAPEVVMTSTLNKQDPARHLPSRETDLHALAVLIYMYLLYRHPLRGGQIHDFNDAQRDESLAMGERALFIEHPTNASNRVRPASLKANDLPWGDPDQIPYTVTGPYLVPLFKRAFIDGLHQPEQRPSANEWETALVKTIDLIQPCQNPACTQGWYVFDNTIAPHCPFCQTPFRGQLPILNLYSSRAEGQFRPDNHRLTVWSGQSLYRWHTNSLVIANERLTEIQKKRVGYFVYDQNQWWLVNEDLPDLLDVDRKMAILTGEKIALYDGLKLLLERQNGGRLTVIQMVNA